MGWRVIITAVLWATAQMAAAAQTQPTSALYQHVTQHRLNVGPINLAYRAMVGLMRIEDDAGELVGDMSYIAYTVSPRRGAETRPVAFVWNGGPGSNSIPLHYGAFGPVRILNGAAKPNAATLLDVTDLVFFDPMEAGFGRFLREGNMEITAETEAVYFAEAIEGWLKSNPAQHRPIFLIGESYGVYRSALVAKILHEHGVALEGLVLISGYQSTSQELDRALQGALRIPGYAAFAKTRGSLAASAGSNAIQVHNAARDWALAQYQKSKATDDEMKDWPKFVEGLSRFTGLAERDILDDRFLIGSSGATNAFNMLANRGAIALFQEAPIFSYDIRYPLGATERAWISRAVVDDLRHRLGFDFKRDYLGLEYDKRLPPDPDVADGLARSTVNVHPYFARDRTDKPLFRPLLEAERSVRIFIAGGVFDDVYPCALGAELARRDLAEFSDRIVSRCYAGGHMIYFEQAVGGELSSDIRKFLRSAPSEPKHADDAAHGGSDGHR